MNTTSSRLLAIALLLLALAGCVQGPWSYWPKDPPGYRGVWTYANVVSGWPLRKVCFEPMVSLTTTVTDAFPFYDSASVVISGPFNGHDTAITLSPQAKLPNCFDGPSDLVATGGGAYHMDVSFKWDSAGHRVLSRYTAETNIPTTFHLKPPQAMATTRLFAYVGNDSIMNLLVPYLGDSILTIRNNPAAWDTFEGNNQVKIEKVLDKRYIPIQSGDTIHAMNPPNDLKSHLFAPAYDSTVTGVVITTHYQDAYGSGATSFDNIFGGPPDTSRKSVQGTTNRLYYLRNQFNPSTGTHTIDSLGISNDYLYIGANRLYFFGFGEDYATYIETAVSGASDSRIRPISNVDHGQGAFAGMLVDSFDVFVKALPGAIVYPFPRARVLACRRRGWESSEVCRTYLPVFCADSLRTSSECRPSAVGASIDSGFRHDSLMVGDIPDPSISSSMGPGSGGPGGSSGKGSSIFKLDSAVVLGERSWCMRHDYPDSAFCTKPKQEALLARDSSLAMSELWNWCGDQSWPIDSLHQCGSGLVSWRRIHKVESYPIQHARDTWCASHASEAQCTFQ